MSYRMGAARVSDLPGATPDARLTTLAASRIAPAGLSQNMIRHSGYALPKAD